MKFCNLILIKTKFETAGSKKHDFGIYQEDEKYFFKLNLQIRFLK